MKTAEAFRSRLEILRQLELVSRESNDSGPGLWSWSSRAEPLRKELAQIRLTRMGIHDFLDHRFFVALTASLPQGAHELPVREQILAWMAQAYLMIQRPMGFTPGRPLALLACILAAEDHHLLEVDTVYRTVYAAARSRWSEYLDFSGGSRFDREFLIRIDSTLLAALEPELGSR